MIFTLGHVVQVHGAIIQMISSEILDQISKLLIAKSETLAVAESVTSGLVTHFLSNANNATKFLQGGLTAYNLGQKTRLLDVNPIGAESVNCVSETVSEQMARGVAARFCANWGVAITGYAVPVPALEVSTCFANFSLVRNGELVKSGKLESNLDTQKRVQEDLCDQLLTELLDILLLLR